MAFESNEDLEQSVEALSIASPQSPQAQTPKIPDGAHPHPYPYASPYYFASSLSSASSHSFNNSTADLHQHQDQDQHGTTGENGSTPSSTTTTSTTAPIPSTTTWGQSVSSARPGIRLRRPFCGRSAPSTDGRPARNADFSSTHEYGEFVKRIEIIDSHDVVDKQNGQFVINWITPDVVLALSEHCSKRLRDLTLVFATGRQVSTETEEGEGLIPWGALAESCRRLFMLSLANYICPILPLGSGHPLHMFATHTNPLTEL
ncbi:hypothetical protein BGZ70_003898, partial [Mortierella alpina]